MQASYERCKRPFVPETGLELSTTNPDRSRTTQGLDLTKQNGRFRSESTFEQSPNLPSDKVSSAHSQFGVSVKRGLHFSSLLEHDTWVEFPKRPQRIESSLHRAEIGIGDSEERARCVGIENLSPDFPARQF